MSKDELKEKILNWTADAGESFFDYFCHDNVKDNHWAFWLLGKGYKKVANDILDKLIKGETCLDQQLLYEIYPEYIDIGSEDASCVYSEENAKKNIALMAEFLTATPYYALQVEEFLNKNNNE